MQTIKHMAVIDDCIQFVEKPEFYKRVKIESTVCTAGEMPIPTLNNTIEIKYVVYSDSKKQIFSVAKYPSLHSRRSQGYRLEIDDEIYWFQQYKYKDSEPGVYKCAELFYLCEKLYIERGKLTEVESKSVKYLQQIANEMQKVR